MIQTDPQKPDSTVDTDVLTLWRPDGDFVADWFTVEFRWEGEEILPTEESINRNLLTSALPLLRTPIVRFFSLSAQLMLLCIDSPDALLRLRISKHYIVIDVQVIESAVAAVRFCENVDGTCCSGKNRVRFMPDGPVGSYFPLESGYIFGRVIESCKSACQTITLSDHPIYGRALVLDREIQFGERDEHLYSATLVAHADGAIAKRVLILGGGDCGVLREVLNLPVERVVMVEYDQEVVRFCQTHFPSVVGDSLNDPRAEVRFGDAFAYLANCQERFDLVLSDLPDTPIGNLTLDDQIELMNGVLDKDGTLGTHAEFNHREGSYEAEPIIAAISRKFGQVDVLQKVIPSYQDQTWLFVKASAPNFSTDIK